MNQPLVAVLVPLVVDGAGAGVAAVEGVAEEKSPAVMRESKAPAPAKTQAAARVPEDEPRLVSSLVGRSYTGPPPAAAMVATVEARQMGVALKTARWEGGQTLGGYWWYTTKTRGKGQKSDPVRVWEQGREQEQEYL